MTEGVPGKVPHSPLAPVPRDARQERTYHPRLILTPGVTQLRVAATLLLALDGEGGAASSVDL